MKRTLPLIIAAIVCLSLLGVVTVHAAEVPAWIRDSAGRIEQAGIPIQALTVPLRQEGKYLGQCANLIEQQAAYCSQYENWHLDIQVLRTSTLAPKKTIEIQDIRNGPTNKCLGTRAGNTYPLHSKSISLEAQSADVQSEDQVFCTVTCSGWTCPQGEAQSEQSFTCKSGTQKTDDCMQTCDFRYNSCRADPNQFDCSVCTPIEQSSPPPTPTRRPTPKPHVPTRRPTPKPHVPAKPPPPKSPAPAPTPPAPMPPTPAPIPSAPAPKPTSNKGCILGQCKFDVYCTAFGQGGCWYCDCSVCTPDASVYQTCR